MPGGNSVINSHCVCLLACWDGGGSMLVNNSNDNKLDAIYLAKQYAEQVGQS